MTELEEDDARRGINKRDKKKTASAAGKSKGLGLKASPIKKQKPDKPKSALSRPEGEEEELDLVTKMEEAKRAMPNALVVSIISLTLSEYQSILF